MGVISGPFLMGRECVVCGVYFTGRRKSPYCRKECYWVAYRKTNKEIITVKRRSYYLKNKDKILLDGSLYYQLNKEKSNKYHNEWRNKNPERVSKYARSTHLAHPETRRRSTQNYQAKKSLNGGVLPKDVYNLLYAKQGGVCAICTLELPSIKDRNGIHLDHIIPISLGGTNTIDNVQLTHPSCNLKKGRRCPKSSQYRTEISKYIIGVDSIDPDIRRAAIDKLKEVDIEQCRCWQNS